MVSDRPVGSVAELWRFPVKSMLGEQLDSAEVSAGGIVGDRAFALVDKNTGKVVSAKSVGLYPDMFRCTAAFTAPPAAGQPLPPVRITLGDGRSVCSDSADIDDVLSDYFKHEVTLADAAPENFTIDMFHPDIEGASTDEKRNTITEQKLGAALFDDLGVPSPVDVGAFFDVFPITVLTTSTLAALTRHRPESRFDVRRFRMNIIVASEQTGFIENDWVGKNVLVGEDVRLAATMPDSRCVMTTLAQDDLLRDLDIMRTMVKHNRIAVGGAGKYPCAGIYAAVTTGGKLQLGDKVDVD